MSSKLISLHGPHEKTTRQIAIEAHTLTLALAKDLVEFSKVVNANADRLAKLNDSLAVYNCRIDAVIEELGLDQEKVSKRTIEILTKRIADEQERRKKEQEEAEKSKSEISASPSSDQSDLVGVSQLLTDSQGSRSSERDVVPQPSSLT